MIYLSEITIPANTPEGSKTETLVTVTKGLIWLIEIEFPSGCSGLVRVQIYDKNYQLFPATPGSSIRGDGVTVKYDDLYLKNTAPWYLKIIAWNNDEAYNHTIQVRIGIASSEAFMSRYMPSVTWEKFNETLAAAAAQQEADKQAMYKEMRQIGDSLPNTSPEHATQTGV